MERKPSTGAGSGGLRGLADGRAREEEEWKGKDKGDRLALLKDMGQA